MSTSCIKRIPSRRELTVFNKHFLFEKQSVRNVTLPAGWPLGPVSEDDHGSVKSSRVKNGSSNAAWNAMYRQHSMSNLPAAGPRATISGNNAELVLCVRQQGWCFDSDRWKVIQSGSTLFSLDKSEVKMDRIMEIKYFRSYSVSISMPRVPLTEKFCEKTGNHKGSHATADLRGSSVWVVGVVESVFPDRCEPRAKGRGTL